MKSFLELGRHSRWGTKKNLVILVWDEISPLLHKILSIKIYFDFSSVRNDNQRAKNVYKLKATAMKPIREVEFYFQLNHKTTRCAL